MMATLGNEERQGVANATMTRAWGVAAACFLVALYAWGFGFYAHGIYLVELQRKTGWSTGFISLVVTAHYVLSALVLPRIAHLIERFGPVLVFLGGLWFSAGALLVLPHLDEPWQLIVAYAFLALGWGATSIAPIAATIGQWFDRRRGLALNLALSGATVSGLAVAPVLLQAVQRHGFVDGLTLMLGVGTAITALAVVLLVRRGPPHGPGHPDARADASSAPAVTALPVATRGVLASAHFWSIAGPFALCLLAQVGLLTHLVPMLTEATARRGGGTTAADPGLALAITTALGLVGRLAFAFVLDRVPQRRAAAISFLNQVVAIAVLALVAEPLAVYAACALYGLSVGNNITFQPLIVQREYAQHEFPRIVALSTAVIQIAYAFGPGVLGVLRDATGTYTIPLWLCAGALVAGAIWVWRQPSHHRATS